MSLQDDQFLLELSKFLKVRYITQFPIIFIFPDLEIPDKTKKAHIPLCWSLDPKEDHFTDREVDTFNPFFSINDLQSHTSHLLEYFKLGKIWL